MFFLLTLCFRISLMGLAATRVDYNKVHHLMHKVLRPPPISSPDSMSSSQFLLFYQRLDHFTTKPSILWPQRYDMIGDYYVRGGPVFLIISGEGVMHGTHLVNGAWVEYAKRFDALVFKLEHRYYGYSHPTSDMHVENLRYLSSRQALADLANFITHMNRQYRLPETTKWIAFGGSYAGNLAAWLRSKYPHLVHGAVASSAPVLAKLDFPEFYEVAARSIASQNSKCVKAIDKAGRMIHWLMKRPGGPLKINKIFRLCHPLDVNNQKDLTNFIAQLMSVIARVVQFNAFYEHSIKRFCEVLLDNSQGCILHRYSAAIGRSSCLEFKYKEMIEYLRNPEWDIKFGARQWIYQTCTEFGYFQTTENKRKLFGKDIPLNFFTQICTDIFGKEFTAERTKRGVHRTNQYYGGLDINATRVVYVHGSLDPWHALGITKTRISKSPVIFINGTSHCADENNPSSSDPPALKAAREKVSCLIGKWLHGPNYDCW